MNLKERIESNLTLYSLSLAVTAFGVGVAADRWAKDVIGSTPASLECKTEAWQELARKSEWTPLAQCPAFPLKIQLTSPGSGTTFQVDSHWPKTLKIPFVVSASRPLPEIGDLGLVVKPKNASNYFVTFPLFARTRDTNSYRADYQVELPVPVSSGMQYEIRAVFVDRKQKLGDRYTELGQILTADPSVVLTEPVLATSENQ